MIAKQAEDSKKEMEEELDSGLKDKVKFVSVLQTAEENAFDEEAAVKVDGRMTKLEAKWVIFDNHQGWFQETMKLPRKLHSGHFTMRKSVKGQMSPSKFGSPKRGE